MKNRKAAGALLNAINETTEEGKAAFFLIERFHDAESGYAGGHFTNEWKALIREEFLKELILEIS